MSTKIGQGPYSNPLATDTDDTGVGSPVIETTFTASLKTVNIGGVNVQAEVFNGEIPGPTLKLTVGDTVVVRLVNKLNYPIGIHWHGIELENYSDGTEVTQNGAVPSPAQTLGDGTTVGGTFLYKFTVTRAGLYWYHPHHGMSINRVFRGLYGMIVVTDPLEAGIVGTVLPPVAETVPLVLSDITVCKAPTLNDSRTFVDPATIFPAADRPEWLSANTAQRGPTPAQFCEVPSAKNDDGSLAAASYAAGEVASVMGQGPPLVEGQTVLTNGMTVGGRKGTPTLPGALVGAVTRDVLSGQGLRLQIVNCAHLRYFRLRLTTQAGVKVNLVRIGGEGGLLDSAILEGGNIGTINTRFESGEIVLPPATRADVVAAIPAGLPATSVLTLWTRDYQRTGDGGGDPNNMWARLPSVPVMHLKVTGDAVAAYTIGAGTALRATAGMPAVETLGAPNATLLNPVTIGKAGNVNQEIQLTTSGAPRFDGAVVPATFMDSPVYTNAPHIAGSSRYAETGKILELKITNASLGHAHHPFHLHGFSFQPVRLDPRVGAPAGVTGTFPWPYREFRDTIDLLPDYTLTFRVRLDARALADGVTPGGALGRWLFHCHIFFHHMAGMISELVVTNATGKEKPNVNVGGSFTYAPIGLTAKRKGTFHHPEGLNMTLTASKGTVVPNVLSPGGTWTWSYIPTAADPPFEYVYITATDTGTRKDQAVFRLQNGGTDTSSDKGDPHIRTVDGTRYDFQAAGEFTLLSDLEGMEIQVRQMPAVTPPPIPDDYTGLTECVSLNSAVAVRVGSHRISYQPFREYSRLEFFLDGKPADLPKGGLDLEAHRVNIFPAGSETGIRIDYEHGPVVTITPHLWTSYGIRYLDVEVANTNAEGGLMGRIPKGTWLPALPSGATLGPMPGSLADRYVALYQTFADAWRVTDATSMFVYLPGRSTETYTDRDWPPQKPPCTKLKPGFQQPANPIRENIPIARAKQICKGVKLDDLNAACVFDVASTGDKSFAEAYLIAQDLRLRSTAVQIIGDKPITRLGQPLTVTATVVPISYGRPTPTGSITFVIDGVPLKGATKLDKEGRAKTTVTQLKAGEHKIRADYAPGGGDNNYYSSSSPNLLHTVTRGRVITPVRGTDAGLLHPVEKKKKPSLSAKRAPKKKR